MPFAIDDKHVIKDICQEKRYSSRRFLKKFPNKKLDMQLFGLTVE